MDEALNLFNLGYLIDRAAGPGRAAVLGGRAASSSGSSASWTTCRRSCRAWRRCCRTRTSATSRSSSRCPTRWAIKQLFPIMPIHRLNEAPTRRAVLGDITCDSDGKIDQFIDLRDVRNTLELHPLRRASRTTSARSCSGRTRRSSATCTTCSATPTRSTSRLDDDGDVDHRRRSSRATRCREVLHYVQYSAEKLTERMRKDVEQAVRPATSRPRSAAVPALLRERAGRVHVPGRVTAVDAGRPGCHRKGASTAPLPSSRRAGMSTLLDEAERRAPKSGTSRTGTNSSTASWWRCRWAWNRRTSGANYIGGCRTTVSPATSGGCCPVMPATAASPSARACPQARRLVRAGGPISGGPAAPRGQPIGSGPGR